MSRDHRAQNHPLLGRMLAVFLGLITLLHLHRPALAENEFTVGEAAYRALQRAQRALEQKKYGEAAKTLRRLQERSSLSKHERALSHETLGHVLVAQNRLAAAAKELSTAEKLQALPSTRQTALLFNLGQIYLSLEKTQQALEVFSRWAKATPKATPGALYTVALAHVQAEHYRNALEYLGPALRAQRKMKGGVPNSWLELALACHTRLRSWGAAIPLAEEVTTKNPNELRRYKQLSAVYSQSGQTQRAVAALELAFLKDLLTQGDDLILLAQNFLALNLPAKAERVLQYGLAQSTLKASTRSLDLLAAARQKLGTLDAAADALSKAQRMESTEPRALQLGQLFMRLRKYADAERTLKSALGLKKLRAPGQIHLLIGISRLKRSQFARAASSFEAAMRHPESQASARAWLQFAQSQKAPGT